MDGLKVKVALPLVGVTILMFIVEDGGCRELGNLRVGEVACSGLQGLRCST